MVTNNKYLCKGGYLGPCKTSYLHGALLGGLERTGLILKKNSE